MAQHGSEYEWYQPVRLVNMELRESKKLEHIDGVVSQTLNPNP